MAHPFFQKDFPTPFASGKSVGVSISRRYTLLKTSPRCACPKRPMTPFKTHRYLLSFHPSILLSSSMRTLACPRSIRSILMTTNSFYYPLVTHTIMGHRVNETAWVAGWVASCCYLQGGLYPCLMAARSASTIKGKGLFWFGREVVG